jgi:hypothetical protein
MLRKLIAVLVAVALPSAVSAGPLTEAAVKAGRELALVQQPGVGDPGGRSGRFWTGLALALAGGALITLGALEVGDDEDGDGPDDEEDTDESDDGEDGDGVHRALLGGGVAAAGVGGWLLISGRSSSPSVTAGRRIVVRHTLRF